MVDKALRYFWGECNCAVRGNRGDGTPNGNELWIHGTAQFAATHHQTRRLAPGAATVHLQSPVRVLAVTKQCLARIRDFIHTAVVVFDVAAV